MNPLPSSPVAPAMTELKPQDVGQDSYADGIDQSSHCRWDPILDRWTIISPGRGQRPVEFVTRPESRAGQVCPFCPGNESMTPPPVMVRSDLDRPAGAPDGREWLVRVVPNRFPAIRHLAKTGYELPGVTAGRSRSSSDSSTDQDVFGSTDHSGGGDQDSQGRAVAEPPLCNALRRTRLLQSRPVCGGHEVVVETPDHGQAFSDYSWPHIEQIFRVIRDRLRYWNGQHAIQYVSVFKNCGPEAGASLSHPHSQLLAIDSVPPNVARSIARMRQHRAETGCCLQCDLIREEFRDGRRIVLADSEMVAYCPFASHIPMQLRVTPRNHEGCFADISDDRLEKVGRWIQRAVALLKSTRGEVAYNCIFNVRPSKMDDASDAFHWSIDLYPRISKVAGFEWGTGMMINSVAPEHAADIYGQSMSRAR